MKSLQRYNKIMLFVVVVLFFATTPVIAFAAPQTFSELVHMTLVYLRQITFVVSGLIFLAFMYGIADFIRKSGDGDHIALAKKRLWWGIIALFVAFSFWGILSFFTSDFFGITNVNVAPQISTGKQNSLFGGGAPCYDGGSDTNDRHMNADGSITVTYGNKELDPCKGADATNEIINILSWGKDKVVGAGSWVSGLFSSDNADTNKTDTSKTDTPKTNPDALNSDVN